MRALMLVGGGILIGVGASWAEATRSAETKANQRVADEMESFHRVAMMVRSEAPVETEEGLGAYDYDSMGNPNPAKKTAQQMMDEADTSDDAITVGGEMIQETSFKETALSDVTPGKDYLEEAQTYWNPEATEVVTRVEYISQDVYEEEDGRAKEQILIHMGGDGEPLFINEGVMVVDWAEIIPNTILADMYTRCGPSVDDKVLYVRNHANDTDYEVTQEIP